MSRKNKTPATPATIRRGQVGSTSAMATRTSPSAGMRAKAAGVNCKTRSGRDENTPRSRTQHGDGQPPVQRVRGQLGAVQPDHVAAARLGQQQQRGGDRDHPGEAIQHSRYGDGEHDALDRGHHLAPVPGWQRRGGQPGSPSPLWQRVAGGAIEQHPAAVILGRRC